MKISVITLFPDMFAGPFSMSMLKKAQDIGALELEFVNLRDFGIGPRKQVDDTPYGGGDGMVLKPEPVVAAIEHARSQGSSKNESNSQSVILSEVKQKRNEAEEYKRAAKTGQRKPKVILLTPQGETFKQAAAQKLATEEHLVLVCGHYEGFDERIREFVDMQISIGDYVLTGGELPAMVLIDSVVRLIPGVLGGEESLKDESFTDGQTLEYPHYTRPEEFRGMRVPDVLLSGHHGEIEAWRRQHSRKK